MREAERQARRVLGVGERALAAEVTRAYRALARRLHPDTGGATADAGRFAEVTAAYRVLVDDRSGSGQHAASRSTAVRIPVRHVRRSGR